MKIFFSEETTCLSQLFHYINFARIDAEIAENQAKSHTKYYFHS